MRCLKCNQELIPQAQYCGYCGNPVNKSKFNKMVTYFKKYALYLALTCAVIFFAYAFFRYYSYLKYATKEEILAGSSSINHSGGPNVINDPNENEEEEIDPILAYDEYETKNLGETYIDFDNTYKGLKITSKANAQEKIVNDSQKEKHNCANPDTLAIENDIIAKYGILGVNLCEMDVSEAQELEKVVAKIYAEFPQARTSLTNLTLTNAKGQNYIAIFYGVFPFATSKNYGSYPVIYKTIIGLNSAYYLNLPILIRDVEISSASGHFPPNATPYSPLAHEFGHYLSFLVQCRNYNLKELFYFDGRQEDGLYDLIMDWNQGVGSQAIIEEARKNYIALYGEINSYDFRSSISKYAVFIDENKNYVYDETIAEAFHDYYINGEQAAKASLEIVKVLKTKLGVGE